MIQLLVNISKQFFESTLILLNILLSVYPLREMNTIRIELPL